MSDNLRKFTKMNYGCGYDKKKGYLNVDLDPACNPDYLVQNYDLAPLPRQHFREIYAKDILEHVKRSQTLNILGSSKD